MDNISELIERLSHEEDAVRKMAVFKLQSNIGDPSFAEIFISHGGLLKLRNLALTASGNTLAYSLTSFSRLLELDKGWEYVNQELISRVVELIVTHPLVNILRGAMSILVSVVSHPHSGNRASQHHYHNNANGPFGFRALRPAIAAHPQFLEMLVSRLSSADHALCANSLQLINSLMRDAIMNESENEWPRFIKRLQELGVIKAVFILMQSSALQDLAHPLLEFQALTKVLLRKWREVKVDIEKKEHRMTLKGLYLASAPNRSADPSKSKRHHPEKWRRLGFETESPAWEFNDVGYLGMMDLTDFVRKHEDAFQKMILEQIAKPPDHRCPVARASLAITAILYQQFDVDKSDIDDAKAYQILESRTNFERAFRPLLLQWTRLHTAALLAFYRLWKETSAMTEDFDKVFELVRVLIHQVIGLAPRTKEVQDVEEEMADFEYLRLRDLQMDLLEQSYENAWGSHLRQVREELRIEALQFVKEQRIRCLLQGEWFSINGLHNPLSNNNARNLDTSTLNGTITGTASMLDVSTINTNNNRKSTKGGDTNNNNNNNNSSNPQNSYRFVRLSHNRRDLHYSDFPHELQTRPTLEDLTEVIDLSTVSSVVSNVIPTGAGGGSSAGPNGTNGAYSSYNNNTQHSPKSPSHSLSTTNSSTNTITNHPHHHQQSFQNSSYPQSHPSSTTKITIHGYPSSLLSAPTQQSTSSSKKNPPADPTAEAVLLTLHPPTHSIASEWLDGLLMLLNQQPITAETAKLVNLVTGYGLKIRLLNVRYNEVTGGGASRGSRETNGGEVYGGNAGSGRGGNGGYNTTPPDLPSRAGVDDDYYYSLFV